MANKKKNSFTMLGQRTATAEQVAANRARIAEQERRVRAGLLKPVVLGLGNAAAAAGVDVADDYLGEVWGDG